jgi:hypothetical protein
MTFTDSHEAQAIKGAVHGAAATLLIVMTVYNATAWWKRRERHLAVNTGIYLAGLGFELWQVHRHCP